MNTSPNLEADAAVIAAGQRDQDAGHADGLAAVSIRRPDWLDLIDDLADTQAHDWYGSRADFRITDEQLDVACATCPDLAIEDGCTLFDASELSTQQWRALAAVKSDPVAIYNAGLSVIAAYRTAIRKEVRDTIGDAVDQECERRRRLRASTPRSVLIAESRL